MKKKILIAIGVIVSICVIILCINYKLVYIVFQNWISPKYELEDDSNWQGGESYFNIPYATESENEYLDLYVPDDVVNPRLLICVHGGGFLYGDTQTRQAQFMYDYFRNHGYAVASVQYRMATEAKFPAAVEDVNCAVRFLRAHSAEYGYSPNEFIIWGESAGGYLAAMGAFTNDNEFNDLKFVGQDELGNVSSQVTSLIDYYGVSDFETARSDIREDGVSDIVYNTANSWAMSDTDEYDSIEEAFVGQNISDMSQEEAEKLSPMYYAKENLASSGIKKIWIAHGTADITVSIQQSQKLYEVCDDNKGEGTKVFYEEMKNCMHADDRFYTEEELDKVLKFLEE